MYWEEKLMKKRLLVFLDLIELIERGGMDIIVHEFLEVIVMAEIKARKLPKTALYIIQKLK
jgi:hypothetical protein